MLNTFLIAMVYVTAAFMLGRNDGRRSTKKS